MQYIRTSVNTSEQLKVLWPSGVSEGECVRCVNNASCYRSVLFGHNLRSGCSFTLTRNSHLT